MDGGIMGPSDRGITASALHRWDLSPSGLPVNYVSSCLVCSRRRLWEQWLPSFLMWLPTSQLLSHTCKLAVVKPGHGG